MRLMEILQLRITLTSIDPPIWRRIQIPATFTFWDLHVAIQDAMGWSDSHLHVFRAFGLLGDDIVEIGIPDIDLGGGRKILHDREVKVEEHLTDFCPVLIYEYDFGDAWTHAVCLEFRRPAEPDKSYPICVAGERACPPEDCGGPFMYPELIEAIADPTHPEHERLSEWAGPYFDPETFDPKEVRFENPEKRWKQTWGAAR